MPAHGVVGLGPGGWIDPVGLTLRSIGRQDAT
jgi:hypothetical protein